MLESDDERELIIVTEENLDLTAADLARHKKINKKGVSQDTVKRVLNRHGLKCLKK